MIRQAVRKLDQKVDQTELLQVRVSDTGVGHFLPGCWPEEPGAVAVVPDYVAVADDEVDQKLADYGYFGAINGFRCRTYWRCTLFHNDLH